MKTKSYHRSVTLINIVFEWIHINTGIIAFHFKRAFIAFWDIKTLSATRVVTFCTPTPTQYIVNLWESMILPSRKHTYIILTPYLVKLGFTKAHIIFLISAKKNKIVGTR